MKSPQFSHNQIEHPAPERWIVMSNALARAGSNLSYAEKRLIIYAISRLDSRRDRPIDEPTVRISAEEYARAFGIEVHTAYEALQDAAQKLFDRKSYFYWPEHRRLSRSKDVKKTDIRWIGRATYYQKQGWVEVVFFREIVPHLMGLTKYFTKYQLGEAAPLRSIYSLKMLELLASYTNEDGDGWAQISIEDFNTSMNVTETTRKNFAWVRKKVIEPACKELRNDGWLIEWRAINKGRKVTGLNFIFRRNARPALPLFALTTTLQ
jgi:plasmid replication initiation protein